MHPALDGLGAVAGLGDDAQVRLALEHEPQAAADDGVVVGEHDPGMEVSGHVGGSSRVTRAPPSGLASSRSVAPISTARSRIPRTPPPSRRRAGSPAPSSSISSARAPAGELEPHLGALRARVARDVGQRLLGDAVEHELGVAAELRQARAGRARRPRARSARPRARPAPAARWPGRGRRAPPGRSRRAIRRTSSRLPRAVSCASITPSRDGSLTSRATRPSCSTTPVSVCPTPSWSSCATRSRSPSCAASARPHAVAPLGLEPFEHLVEGRGQLGGLGVPAADLEPVAGLQRVDPARELRQLAQRGERAAQQQQVEREHQHEAAAEDRQLAQRDVLHAAGRTRAR